MQQGVAAHKKGKLQEAEHLCRAILGSQPSHPDAKHNLGLLAVSFDRVDIAVPLFKTALEANPKIEQFWLSRECKDTALNSSLDHLHLHSIVWLQIRQGRNFIDIAYLIELSINLSIVSTRPVYRVFYLVNGSHLFTTSEIGKQAVQQNS